MRLGADLLNELNDIEERMLGMVRYGATLFWTKISEISENQRQGRTRPASSFAASFNEEIEFLLWRQKRRKVTRGGLLELHSFRDLMEQLQGVKVN